MYFALEVLHQQILSQHPSYLVLSALLEQPFPEFHKAHGNQDLISYLPGKIPIMSSHWCNKSDIKTGSVVISIPAPGDCDVLLKRKAKNQIFCLFTTFLLFTQDVWSYCVYIYILIAIYSLEWVRISWESMKSKTKSSGTAPAVSDQFWWWILRWDSLGCFPFPTKTASWWKNTHTDNFPPSSLHPLSKHSFKDLRPLSLPLPRRSSRDVNSPAPVDCQLSQWSGWTDCFPCQEKKVRIHCNVFIYLQMCLWWGCTHINYIYYTYSSFWSIQ